MMRDWNNRNIKENDSNYKWWRSEVVGEEESIRKSERERVTWIRSKVTS